MASQEEGMEDILVEESSRDKYPSKSDNPRSYRSRDHNYEESETDSHRQSGKRHKERRHGDRPSSRRHEERHGRSTDDYRKSNKFRRDVDYNAPRDNKSDFRRSRSRSPKHPSRDKHGNKRPHPLTSYYSEPKGAWHHKSHAHYHKSRSAHNSDSETERKRRNEKYTTRSHDVSSNSSISSESEGEFKETTPTSLKIHKEESAKDPAPVMKWTEIAFSDSEEEREKDEKRKQLSPENVTDNSGNDVMTTPPTKDGETDTPTQMEQEGEELKEETPPPTPPTKDEVLYIPALMGCRSVESYEWLNRIEEGTYGVVFRAKDTRTGEIVALKKLKMEKEREGFPITSLREISTLLKANHDNIVNVREIVVGSNMDKIFIVMDYVEHDLKSLMETMKQPFLEGEIKTLLIQLLRAVHHLHDNWIIHRDLKTSNLLLSHKGILKVADFGLAREYGSPLQKYTPVVVTLWYRAPELLLGAKEYSVPIDMWSVGCIFAELLQHKPLFMGKSEIDQLNQIFKELGTPSDAIWPGFSQLPVAKKVQFTNQPLNNLRKRFPMIVKSGFNLLNKFFAYDPSRRITAEEALKQEYFEESPLPVDPGMFPTWPAKSEMIKKTTRQKSPTAPEGGAFFHEQKEDSDKDKFQLPPGEAGKAGPGFTLKF